MPSEVVIDCVGGPGELDLLVHGYREGEEQEFTLQLASGKIKCVAVVNGMCIADAQREVWTIGGTIKTSPEKDWEGFGGALYCPRLRRGHFVFATIGGDDMKCPRCENRVPKSARFCTSCGADQSDAG